jgi:hypothetical protein
LQPVAAGPAKVGENVPKLDDETTLLAFVTGGAAVALETSRLPLTVIDKVAIRSQLDLRFPIVVMNIKIS